MKTILSIGGDRYLIPRPADVSKILDLLQGVTEVRNRTIYGPEGKLQYDDQFYTNREVLDDRPARFRVELVHDDEVCTGAEFAALEAETKARIAALPPEAAAPEAVSRS
jgi:hypothetical protein